MDIDINRAFSRVGSVYPSPILFQSKPMDMDVNRAFGRVDGIYPYLWAGSVNINF